MRFTYLGHPVRLCLSASHSTVFFSHNKLASASQTPSHGQANSRYGGATATELAPEHDDTLHDMWASEPSSVYTTVYGRRLWDMGEVSLSRVRCAPTICH
jgi:hypothetical protein